MSAINIKTQKALGVQWLSTKVSNTVSVPYTIYITDERDTHLEYTWPKFGRPCPITPRHGFVDSRIINSRAELQQLWREARAADPKAELMLMEPLKAIASAVLTPTMASIGPGNDGATAGKAGTIIVSLLYVDMPAPPHLIPKGSVPYAELVFTEDRTYAVQWRSGPPVGAGVIGDSWIPNDTTVKVLIPADEMSALDLERACETAIPGTVVWQPDGNMISHAAVHARLNNLPIIFTTNSPRQGTLLLKNTGENAPTLQEDAFRAALTDIVSLDKPLGSRLPEAILWAMHQAPALCESVAGARFVAQAATDIWRYAATACIGEARHSVTTKSGNKRQRKSARDNIYRRVLQVPGNAMYLRSALKFVWRQFEDNEQFYGGFGGKAWAQCAESALSLYRALSEAANGTGTISKVITAAHVVINTAHNNGRFLNKFINGDIFDALARGNWQLTAQALKHFYRAATTSYEPHTNVWPLLRNRRKAALIPLSCIYQWMLRDDGNTLHVQCGKLHKYTSGSLPMSVLSRASREEIRAKATLPPAGISFYGSNIRYWEASLPDDVIALLTTSLTGDSNE